MIKCIHETGGNPANGHEASIRPSVFTAVQPEPRSGAPRLFRRNVPAKVEPFEGTEVVPSWQGSLQESLHLLWEVVPRGLLPRRAVFERVLTDISHVGVLRFTSSTFASSATSPHSAKKNNVPVSRSAPTPISRIGLVIVALSGQKSVEFFKKSALPQKHVTEANLHVIVAISSMILPRSHRRPARPDETRGEHAWPFPMDQGDEPSRELVPRQRRPLPALGDQGARHNSMLTSATNRRLSGKKPAPSSFTMLSW